VSSCTFPLCPRLLGLESSLFHFPDPCVSWTFYFHVQCGLPLRGFEEVYVCCLFLSLRGICCLNVTPPLIPRPSGPFRRALHSSLMDWHFYFSLLNEPQSSCSVSQSAVFFDVLQSCCLPLSFSPHACHHFFTAPFPVWQFAVAYFGVFCQIHCCNRSFFGLKPFTLLRSTPRFVFFLVGSTRNL